jgi:hypothetical protein
MCKSVLLFSECLGCLNVSCLRYDLRETSDGSIKFLSKWEMSKALQVEAFKV